MTSNIQHQVQTVEAIMAQVNGFWIKYKGNMRDHAEIWDATLHKFTNEDWHIILNVMELIRIEDSTCYIRGAKEVFDQARKVLEFEGHAANPRALDKRRNKKLAYKTLMNVKDCWNNFTGYTAPTRFDPDPAPATAFEQLFEQLYTREN